MNLLLLLSALMSAITGGHVGGARAPVAAEQVARVGQVVASIAVSPAATERPQPAIDRLAARRRVASIMRQAVPGIAVFTSRLRI